MVYTHKFKYLYVFIYLVIYEFCWFRFYYFFLRFFINTIKAQTEGRNICRVENNFIYCIAQSSWDLLYAFGNRNYLRGQRSSSCSIPQKLCIVQKLLKNIIILYIYSFIYFYILYTRFT